jgi:gliding motility-associated-like protein
MKKLALSLCVFIAFAFTKSQKAYSQVPTTCFEIQSILVDACGNPEGENEMVRFIVGPNPLNTNTLTATWPNNPYLGICQSPQTAANVLALNSTITSCGFIKEPTAGVLPAGSTVILVTSENMDVTANSFAGLTDTLYMIFQCSGNTSGHFRNYSSTTALRTLTISFGGGCTDVVTYDANFLINQSGNPGAGDGATVDFTFAGNDTYTNPGCQAPINQLTVATTASNDTICNGDAINLNALIQGSNFASYFWSGGAGNFSSTTTLSTIYTANATIGGNENLYFNLVTSCGDTLVDTTAILVNAGGTAAITPSGPTTICPSSSVQLSASGGTSYIWSTGATTPTISVNTTGNYTVTVTGACGAATASESITVITAIPTTITVTGSTSLCPGDSAILTATGNGNGNYVWSNGATTQSITVFSANNYTVTSNGVCDTTAASVTITAGAAPNVVITPSGPTTFCQGGQVTLTASGADTYLWSTSSTATSILVFVGGTYTITGTTSCGVNSTSINVTIETPPTTTITPSGPTTFCQGSTVTLTATGANSYLWSTGSTANSIVVSNSGTYTLTGTNACGSVSANEVITVSNLPTAIITNSSPLNFCQGDSVLLTASGGSSYLWSTGNTASSIYASIAGVYALTTSNLCGSANTSATVSVLPLPIATTNIDSALLCPGDDATLIASGGNAYLWSDGSTNSSLSVTTAGTYSVTVANSCGNDIASVFVDASSLTVGFIADNYNGFAPLTVNFTNNSTNFSTYAWNFGDNTTSADLNPTHIFTEDGVFNTVLTVNDTNGCVLTTNADIVVRSDISYFIPNVFTPNSDSINDYFNIVGTGINSIKGRIFNRWGQEVYNWDSLQKGWDGNSNGTESPSAVYFYLINLNVSNGTERVERGTVTLLR